MQKLTFREKITDRIVAFFGSWACVNIQTFGIIGWIILNYYKLVDIDPYPWLLLNFVLSYLGAFSTPFIIMASNRKNEIDAKVMLENILLNQMQTKALEELKNMLDDLVGHIQTESGE